jgi:mannose-6-phosphate isomerase
VDEKGRPRKLHTEQALEAIDFNAYPGYKTRYEKKPDQPNLLKTCEYFTTNYLEITRELERDYVQIESFVIYMCLEGSFSILCYNGETETVEKGETVLLPAEIKNVKLIPDKMAKILEIYIEGMSVNDRTAELLETIF